MIAELPIRGLLALIKVLGSQVFFLSALPLLAASRISTERRWPEIAAVSTALGLASQSVLGLFWNHLVRRSPSYEAGLYVLLWIAVTAALLRVKPYARSKAQPPAAQDYREILILGVILLLAVVVRSLHPLRHAALGQSDAYNHLQFLRDLIAYGTIRGGMYPPGYHWTMALPAVCFGLDAYTVMRYGGAYFGAVLVLALFVLLRAMSGRSAALIGSFAVACFPAFNLLIKTGIGAFANQLGLAFIPLAIYFYGLFIGSDFGSLRAGLLLAAVLCGLAAAVPMMLIHLAVVFTAERLAVLAVQRRGWLSHTFKSALLTLPSLALLFYHISRRGPEVRETTIGYMVVGGSPLKAPAVAHGFWQAVAGHPIIHMLVDFFTIKRWGFADPWYNAAGCLLLVLFGYFLFRAAGRRDARLFLTAVWGLIAAVQTITGWMQFSAYQREGWSLLIATGCLAGIVGGSIYDEARRWPLFRWAFTAALCGSILFSVTNPPGHRMVNSSAEDEVVGLVRSISAWKRGIGGAFRRPREARATKEILALLDPDAPLTMVSRRFGGWDNGHGELVSAVLGPLPGVRSVTVDVHSNLEAIFNPSGQFLILIDRDAGLTSNELGAFAQINPFHAQKFVADQAKLRQANQELATFIENRSRSHWLCRRFSFCANLDVILLSCRQNQSRLSPDRPSDTIVRPDRRQHLDRSQRRRALELYYAHSGQCSAAVQDNDRLLALPAQSLRTIVTAQRG